MWTMLLLCLVCQTLSAFDDASFHLCFAILCTILSSADAMYYGKDYFFFHPVSHLQNLTVD